MSTQAVGTYKLNSFWESGRLIFYEKAYGHTTTGNVFILGHDYVQIGDTANDVDFQYYGTGSRSFVIDCGAATVTSGGLNWAITGTLAVTGDITLTGDVTLSGDLTLSTEDISIAQGRFIYLDGQNGGEYLTSDTSNKAMLNATTEVDLAIGGTDEVQITSSAITIPSSNITVTSGSLTLSSGNATLTSGELALAAGNASLVQGWALYLDGQDGGEFLISDAANYAELNGTTGVNLAIGGTEEVQVTSSAVTIPTNNLTLTAGELALGAGNASVVQGAVIYLDGQDGGEYLASDTTNETMLNATTTLNLAINSTDEVSITSSAVTIGTNDLTLSVGDFSVAQGSYIYLDGQAGGEYLYSSAANEADLNATTEVNLRIGGSTKIAVTSAYTNVMNDVTLTSGEFISGAPIKMPITTKSADTKYLTATESGVINASADAIYLYLPTYVGNAGLTYFVKATASFSAGVKVYGYDATENLDGANVKTSTAQYDALTVIAHTSGWHILEKIGTWN